ncbi:hypothetical protein, partial [Gluconobacter cerinus]|uniref:hypothetical protein n=1 Tax=Gluconobacter cerinus TaxID=38307 RepID=UPI001B8AEF2B
IPSVRAGQMESQSWFQNQGGFRTLQLPRRNRHLLVMSPEPRKNFAIKLMIIELKFFETSIFFDFIGYCCGKVV